MNTKLVLLEKRIKELSVLSEEVEILAKKLLNLEDIKTIQPQLSIKWQQRYRWARELLIQNNFSGIEEFDRCYNWYLPEDWRLRVKQRAFEYIEHFIEYWINEYRYKQARENKESNSRQEYFWLFMQFFRKAQNLLLSSIDEILSRELPIATQLSFELVSEEFDIAQHLLEKNSTNETLIRTAWVVCRIWLERHLLTVIENKQLSIIINPPTKKKAEASDYIETLNKNWIITPIQKSKLEHLFKIGNNCAHPKEVIKYKDVEDLINDAKNIASVIL